MSIPNLRRGVFSVRHFRAIRRITPLERALRKGRHPGALAVVRRSGLHGLIAEDRIRCRCAYVNSQTRIRHRKKVFQNNVVIRIKVK